MKRRIAIGLGCVLALALAFVGGRYSAPARVVERVKVETRTVTITEWRDRIVTKRVEGPTRTVERIVEKPGEVREVTRWIDAGPVTTDTDTNLSGHTSGTTESTSATVRMSETGRPGWGGGLAAQWDPGRLSASPAVLGLEVDRRLFGPLWVGVRASAGVDLSDPRVGLALRGEW